LGTRAGYSDGLEALDLYQHDQAAAAAHWQQRIAQWWQARPAAAGSMAWTQASFDDAAWPLMRLGGIWEELGIPALQNFDGVVWFRSTLTLDEAQARSASALELGPIDDMDTTWINGQEIGSTDGWDTPRHYALPPGTLHAGVNEISVRVFDGGGGGGLYGTAQQRRVLLSDGSRVPLADQWHYRIAGTLGEVGTPPHPPWQPAVGLTTLYNGMIHPLAGLALRGVLWYQGEANVGEPQEYAALLPLFMQDWRARFGADLPMLIVQLANFGPASAHPAASAWASLRNEQRRAVVADAHAGLAVTIDIGDRYDIHPTNKQEVGHRLALLARHRVYGEALEDSGPTPVHARREGKGLRIEFAHAEGGLVVSGANRPSGFELCVRGAACRYVDASARGNAVWLEASAPAAPATLRYAWGDSPQCNLYNQAGLPAVPFEIDIE